MEGKRLIEKIKLRNILSFGDKGEEIELQPLNIIIGQNASGKSNLVDVIKLLRSLPQDKGLANFISKSGGISEWIWKGINSNFVPAEIEIVLSWFLNTEVGEKVNYKISFRDLTQRLQIVTEIIENLLEKEILLRNENVHYEESIVSTRVIIQEESTLARAFLQSQLSKIFTCTDLQTFRSSEIRKPQVPDAPNDFLEEDGSNLALVLNDLQYRGEPKDKIVANLKKFNPQIKDYFIQVLGGTVQLYLREEFGNISAKRISDGTLRYLCLLAILCHPEPPPLICIEEPETGLHPDILPTIAELMIEASQRTQLIVTTHSDILVSAFSERPEAVLVCEKDEDGTHFKRLEADKLKVWLDEYSLGETWLRGGIGGTRW
jgi:predicted ATPase